jgi:hypothetical protein
MLSFPEEEMSEHTIANHAYALKLDVERAKHLDRALDRFIERGFNPYTMLSTGAKILNHDVSEGSIALAALKVKHQLRGELGGDNNTTNNNFLSITPEQVTELRKEKQANGLRAFGIKVLDAPKPKKIPPSHMPGVSHKKKGAK